MWCCHVGQAGLELLTSDHLSASASQSAGIIGTKSRTVAQWGRSWLTAGFVSQVQAILLPLASAFQIAGITVEMSFHHVGQAGLELLTS
ncbi:hypothetical protein AAY473_005831 [Plecturocebus cupreus]